MTRSQSTSRRRGVGSTCAGSVVLLILAFLLAESLAADYTVSVWYIGTAGGGCMYLNDGVGEQYSFLLSLPGTQPKCWHHETHDDNTWTQDVDWDFDITTTKSSVVLSFEAFEKNGDGDVCTYEGSDDEWNHLTSTLSLQLDTLETDQSKEWSFYSKIPNKNRDCWYRTGGSYTRRPSNEPAGSPRINSTSLTIVNNELQLTITGKELNPDPQEPPVVQIFGVETGCKTANQSGMSISNTKITCTLTRPESDKVSNLDMQVQVQTSYGVTRQATVAFPKCSSPCQNNGTCWWSQDFGKLECVCSSFLYYGDHCENKYPDGVPIVHEIAPIGGDYTKDIVIAVAGRGYPEDDDSITAVVCELSWTGNTQKIVGNTLVDERDVAWSGPLQPYKGENIAQADSLQLVGVCRIPGGTFEAPTPAKRRAQVTVIWQRNATGESIRSQQKKEFMLYGPLHVPSSSAKTVSNPIDGDMRVFRDQSIQVTLSDSQGNLRVGGEDADVFFVNWHAGPSTDPRFGIKGGDTKSFKYSKCRANPDDATCAYYEIKVSFDFSGDYKANVYTTDRQTLNLATINQADLIFSIKGFGEATLPVPANLPSSISWADQLQDRQNISIFDKGLAQLISPNTGARDRSNLLGPLFQRWKGGWFTQRQTVSLAFESALSQATFGSVHVIRSQGTEEPFFCDTHTDELEAGPLATTLVPWEATGNVPNTFPLIGLAFTDGDCLTALTVTIELLHRDPNSVGLMLTRVGLASTSPRAKNTTTTVVLKQATTNSAPLGDGIPSPVVLRYNMQTTPGLAGFKGLPALADWTLTATGPTERGHIKSWYIDANSEYCLKSAQVDNTICGEGGGQYYARAANVDDRLVLECPQGGVITKIQWARFGKLEGSCDEANVQVIDGCEANTTIVKQRVESVCVGHTSCELMALDTQFAVEIGEPFLCPGELPPCPDDASLVVADDVSSTQTKRGRRLPRNSAELERRLPWSYPGTEDHYYKSTHVRHVAEPLFRPRRSAAEPITCTYSSVRPKKALMVQALCEDTNAAFKARDSPPVEKKMLMTSVSADFDNDWKDETFTLYGYEGGNLHASFTYLEAGKPRTQVYKSLTIGGVPIILATGGQLSMQTGDFDSDGYPEVVFGFIDGPTGKLRLILWDLDIDNVDTWHALAKESRTNLQACGCFDKTNIIPLIFDGASELTVPSQPTLPVRLPDGRRTDSPGFSFALAAGDIGMFGFDTFAVAWIDDSASVAWSLYQRNEAEGIAPVLAEPIRLRSLKHPHAIALNLANFDGSGMCELALGIIDDTDAKVYLYTIDQLEEGFPMKQTKVISVNPSSVDNIDGLWGADPQFMQRVNLQMVSGDLDDDGDAEIVVAYTASGVAHITRIDAPGTGTKCRRVDCMEMFGKYTAKLSLGGSTGVQKRSPEIKLAIGNVDDSSANELLVAVEYQSTVYSDSTKVMLTSLTAQPNKDYPFSVNGRHCYAGPYFQQSEQADIPTVNNMALTVGNLYGLGFRVGEPSTIRYEGVPELIAVINAPPTHYDITDDGAELIVNPGTFHGGGSFAELSNIEGIVSSFDVTRETASASTTSHGFQLNAKIAVVFGNVDLAWKDFTSNSENNGFAHTEQIAVSRDVVAAGDDSVLFMSTDKDVWKYPIVDQSGNQVGSLDITLSSSCGENCVQKADGRDLWWYTPEHELFNILTYSSRAPIDFNPVNRIMVGEKVALGPNAHEQWVDQQAGKSQNKISLNHTTSGKGAGGGAGIQVGVDYNFAASFMGVGPQIKLPIGINVMAGYAGRTESTKDGMYAVTQSANINRDASVHCYLESISPLHAYKVQPFVYMATAGSKEYLKLDYTVEPGFYPGVSSWWQRTYNKPDPTFNMPWWWTTFKRDRTMLTKEIIATPAFPKLGETVQVTVTVRNKALVQANNVPVTLWRGNPENCLDLDCLFPGRTLIGATRINLIPAQSKQEVSFLLKYDGTHNIHATIDDRNEMAETHEGNNHGYNLLFHNLRDQGYTLQSLNLENTLILKPVKGTLKGNKRYTQGYDVAMTILGDTFTRQNVLVQLWHGAVGGTGRLLTTINVPRVRGSVGSTIRYTLSAYWDTRNPALYGKQELHAVILHSGFDITPDNVVAHVSQTVTVDCFGEVDMCGVCRGDNTQCAGCDGVPLSGKTVDVCGKCGGDGSTCCVRRPSQATTHYIKLTNDPSASNNKRVKVGDLVVWENLLDWNVLISGGVFSYAGSPTFGLSALQQNGFPIQGAVPPMTLDDETVNAYVQQYLSILTTKDIVEPTGSAPSVPTPVPDSTTKYLRRSAAEEHHDERHHDDEEDILGLSRFPGFRVSAPTQRVAESRLQNIREAYEQHRRSFAEYDDPYYAEMGYAYAEYDGELSAEDDEDIFMEGICCAPEDEDHQDHGRRNAASSRVSRLPPDHDYDLHQHELVRQAHARGLVQARTAAASAAKRHTKPSFSLRSLTLSILQHQTNVVNSSSAIPMDDRSQQMRRRDSSSTTTYYDVRSHEQVESQLGEELDRMSLRRARCLCPVRAGSSHSRRVTGKDGKPAEAAKPAEPAKADEGQSAATPAKTDAAGEEKPPTYKDKMEDADANGAATMGSGELGTPDVGVASSMSGATSFGVVTFSGFGPARGWSLYDFGEFTKATVGDTAVMAPGSASAPHRFFSPGIYVWHDSNNPVLHGVVIVDPSDLVTDVCGICGGDGKSCLDCKNKPFGTAVRDVCGVCYDPLFDDYDPSKARDCAGVCNGTAKIDECGYCAGGSTGLTPGFSKDCSGQCNGTTPSYCGVCGASQATHSFLADCAGECGGPRVTNKCGYCVGGDTGLDALHGMDCLGSCGGTAVRDCRGECEGQAKLDCAGVCGGSARMNTCYRCVNGSTGLDDAQTRTCDGICAVAPLTPCGVDPSPQTRDFGFDSFEERNVDERACSSGLVADRQGTCCDPGLIDCTNLCRGSASVVCGVCVGGSSGTDASEVRDCKGVCNGTAVYNPCGVCTTPAEYHNGTGYYVDCANVCSGSAYVDSCGMCVEGSTGVAANSSMDCQGTCNGTAIRDDCGVCYRPGDGTHVPNSGMDCAGVCNGTAVRDDCNSCVLGTTRREFNADKDCAGQCFGQHVASDPACTCPAGQLDQCFVCGGNNTQCAGCDGIPWSGKTRDFCGVCGGNNTACCFLPFAQTTATIKDFESIVLRHTLETGETLAITNLHDGYAYSMIMYRLDVPADVARVKQIQTRWDYATLRPGNTLNIVIREPGLYRLTSIESSSITFELRVSYNTKLADVCGRCVYPPEVTSSTVTAISGKATSNSSVTITNRDEQIEYDHCCRIMPTNNVHDWFQTTYYYEMLRPEQVTRVVPFTGSYAAAATEHRVRLLEPQTIDPSAWWHGKILAVGDVVVLENRDTLDHVVSFSGPQPMPDVLLNRGTTIFTPPFLKPGTYRLQSNKNLINTTFTVAFGFSCSVYSQEAPPPAEDDNTLLIVLTTTLGGSFLVLVALVLLIAGAAAIAYTCSRPHKVETHAPSMYPL